MSEFAAFVGIDWSDKKHDVCLVEAATGRKEFSVIKHNPQALQDWALQLRSRFPGKQVAVCLEQSRGPLLFALLQFDSLVLFPVHPKTLSSYREAFSPSRAKDDPTDAEYLVELVIHHRDRLKAWRADDEKTRTLRYLVEHRRRLVNDRTRLSNRLTAALKSYFPQVLDWFPDIRTPLVCEFLRRWPELVAVKRARPATLEQFFRAHHSTRRQTNRQRLTAIGESVALVTDRAVINASKLPVQALVRQMQATLMAIKEFDRAIEQLCAEHQDFHLFSTLPGAGTVYAARLLSAFGTDRQRFTTADEVACLVGVSPVIERSGQSSWTRWRYFCPKFLRQSFIEYAGESIVHCRWAKLYYQQQRGKGKSHQAVPRALAFKWIRIMWKCWQARTPYDEKTYLAALHKQGSPLWQQFAAELEPGCESSR